MMFMARRCTVQCSTWRSAYTAWISTVSRCILPWEKRAVLSTTSLCHRRHYSSHLPQKGNLILMGSPGCGKTTVARVLGRKLERPVLDIDDHHLEPYWKMPVSQKLDEVGSDGFVEEEGRALLHFQARDSVVALTGSNPMHEAGMNHVAKCGLVVFLDVNLEDILERLERMKVNRIVGQNDGISMRDILLYRQQFYESRYDVRIICEQNEDPESVADKVIRQVDRLSSYKGFVSTRRCDDSSNAKVRTFSEVVLQGLSDDGGLYVSGCSTPYLSIGEWSRLVHIGYEERAARLLERWLHPFNDLHPRTLKEFVSAAYGTGNFDCSRIAPVRHLPSERNNQYLVELFHGPTASFKDAALQLMPQFFTRAVRQSSQEDEKYLVLVATSGDTGGAVLDGFSKHTGDSRIGVMVLYPAHGTSNIQRRQMTAMTGRNISVIGVEGDFDFCQNFVKKAFQDQELASTLQCTSRCSLSAANSINWGRLLPQVVYHASAYLDLVQSGVVALGDKVDLCIPTGNFGNILAAFYAKEMGIPFHDLICASNANNILTDFLHTGIYDVRGRRLQQTISPAIDILVSSNLERLLYHLCGQDTRQVRHWYNELANSGRFTVPEELLKRLQSMFVAGWCNEDQCKETIRDTLKESGYLLDPHTAVAKRVADTVNTGARPMLIASTAHPDKFANDVLGMLDEEPKHTNIPETIRLLHNVCDNPTSHKALAELVSRDPVHTKVCNPSYSKLVDEVVAFAKSL